MQLDRNNSMPLYVQVEKILEEKITTSQWEEGTIIPTENELAQLMEVSNITIKRAIMNLVDKGMLIRYRGKGTFVTRAVEKDIYKSNFFTMSNKGGSSHETLDQHTGLQAVAIAKQMELPHDTPFIYLKRVSAEGEENVALEYTYIPCSVWPENQVVIEKNDFIYDLLQHKCGIQLKNTKNFFSASVANSEEAKLLNLDKYMPLFVWERITFSTSGKPVEYSKFVMKQDKEKYYIEVELD